MAVFIRTPLEELLVENSRYSNRTMLKRRLINELGWEDKCSIEDCPNPLPLWAGRTLVLQLDHINGVSDDNRLENLRIICPNCHSQTETFCGRRNKKSGKVKTSDELSPDEVENIKRLSYLARQARHQLPYDDERVAASRELDRILLDLRDKGYVLRVLAEVTGSTTGSVYTRLNRAKCRSKT